MTDVVQRGGRPWWMTPGGRGRPGDAFQDWTAEPTEARQGLANLDLWEEDGRLVLEAELPGLAPEDVEVDVQPRSVSFRARREESGDRLARHYLVQESPRGSIARTVRLPREVEVSAADARFLHGVLRVEMPLKEQAGRRRIEVRSRPPRRPEADSTC